MCSSAPRPQRRAERHRAMFHDFRGLKRDYSYELRSRQTDIPQRRCNTWTHFQDRVAEDVTCIDIGLRNVLGQDLP